MVPFHWPQIRLYFLGEFWSFVMKCLPLAYKYILSFSQCSNFLVMIPLFVYTIPFIFFIYFWQQQFFSLCFEPKGYWQGCKQGNISYYDYNFNCFYEIYFSGIIDLHIFRELDDHVLSIPLRSCAQAIYIYYVFML